MVIPLQRAPIRHATRFSFLRRVLLPLALLAFLSACHTWVPLSSPGAQAIAQEGRGTVRLTLADGSRVVLKEPRVRGDSLVAFDDTAGVALVDVRQVEARRTKVLATAGLIFGAASLAVVGTALAVCYLGACAGT